MNLIRRLDENKLDDALRRIDELERGRTLVLAILALCVKGRLFTAKEFDTEMAIASAIDDQMKAAEVWHESQRSNP